MERDSPARPSLPYPYHLAVRATLRDTDAMGHANNAVYLSWFEEIRTLDVRDRRGGGGLPDLDVLLAAARLEFRSPVHLHETVDLWLAPCRIGRSSWDLAYEARARADGRLVLETRTVQVQYDYRNRKPVPIPEPWRRSLEADRLDVEGRA